jgi:predicted GIY-YIG superfamily endonuclease
LEEVTSPPHPALSTSGEENCSTFGRIEDAIAREKQVKKWNRSWKDKLISIPRGKIYLLTSKIT